MDLNPEKLKDYREKDLDYKTQARKLICDGLGYEPPLRVSILSELSLRASLRCYSQNDMSKQDLDDHIEFQLDFINRLMMEHTPSFNC